MRMIRLISLIMALSWVIASCSIDDNLDYNREYFQDSTPLAGTTKDAVFVTAIRFESEAGTNILTCFSDIPVGEGFVHWEIDSVRYLSVECVRGSDGALMTWSDTGLFFFDSERLISCCGEGPLLMLKWMDMDLRSGKNKPSSYDETYTINIVSSRLTNSIPHTIKWTVHVEGDRYAPTMCELDGEKVDFKNSLYYETQYYSPENGYAYLLVNSLIHIPAGI